MGGRSAPDPGTRLRRQRHLLTSRLRRHPPGPPCPTEADARLLLPRRWLCWPLTVHPGSAACTSMINPPSWSRRTARSTSVCFRIPWPTLTAAITITGAPGEPGVAAGTPFPLQAVPVFRAGQRRVADRLRPGGHRLSGAGVFLCVRTGQWPAARVHLALAAGAGVVHERHAPGGREPVRTKRRGDPPGLRADRGRRAAQDVVGGVEGSDPGRGVGGAAGLPAHVPVHAHRGERLDLRQQGGRGGRVRHPARRRRRAGSGRPARRRRPP